MRKTIEILLFSLTVLFLACAFVSCKRSEKLAELNASALFSRNFSCMADVQLDGHPFEVQYRKQSPGTCSMTFSKPEELRSLSFNMLSDGLKVQYGSLSATVDPSVFPQSSIISSFQEVFQAIASKSAVSASIQSKGVRLSGSSAAGSYSLLIDSSGAPKQLEISSLKLKADFSHFSV